MLNPISNHTKFMQFSRSLTLRNADTFHSTRAPLMLSTFLLMKSLGDECIAPSRMTYPHTRDGGPGIRGSGPGLGRRQVPVPFRFPGKSQLPTAVKKLEKKIHAILKITQVLPKLCIEFMPLIVFSRAVAVICRRCLFSALEE